MLIMISFMIYYNKNDWKDWCIILIFTDQKKNKIEYKYIFYINKFQKI